MLRFAMLLCCALAAAADEQQGLSATQSKLIEAVRKAARHVVTIETLGGTTPGGGKLFKGGRRPGRRGSFRQAVDATTTGLVVGADGLIVTSAFNFNTKPQITTVILPDGREFVARLVARDFSKGLALLKIDAAGLSVPRAVPAAKIETGRWAVALGRAYAGKSPSSHFGIVSATNRISGKALQTDAPCSPVNYGGPLIDLEGDVLGVIVPLSTRGSGVGWYDSGIGFAIPLADVLRDLKFMLERKTLHAGFLGVELVGDYDGPGAKIKAVQPGSGAEKGGIEAGDVVLEIERTPVLNRFDLQFQVGKRYAGDTIEVKVRRGGETFPRRVTLGRPPARPARPPVPPGRR